MAHIAVELHSIRVKEMQNNVLNQNVYPMQMVSLLLAHPMCFRHYATNVLKNAFDLLEVLKHLLLLFTVNDPMAPVALADCSMAPEVPSVGSYEKHDIWHTLSGMSKLESLPENCSAF